MIRVALVLLAALLSFACDSPTRPSLPSGPSDPRTLDPSVLEWAGGVCPAGLVRACEAHGALTCACVAR